MCDCVRRWNGSNGLPQPIWDWSGNDVECWNDTERVREVTISRSLPYELSVATRHIGEPRDRTMERYRAG